MLLFFTVAVCWIRRAALPLLPTSTPLTPRNLREARLRSQLLALLQSSTSLESQLVCR